MQLGVAHKILCKSTFAFQFFQGQKKTSISLFLSICETRIYISCLTFILNSKCSSFIKYCNIPGITNYWWYAKTSTLPYNPKMEFSLFLFYFIFLSSSMLNGIFFRLHFCLSFLYRKKHAFHAYIQLHSYF